MPIGILKFKLPEEREEFEMTQKAWAFYGALLDLQDYIRKLRKYDERELVPKEELIDKLGEILSKLDI